MDCFIEIDSVWVETDDSVKVFSRSNIPIAHLNTSGGISYGHKETDFGIILPMIHISTNNIKSYIEERAANLVYNAGYWGHIRIFIYTHSDIKINGTESKVILCMFYVPDDSVDDPSSVAHTPEKVNVLKYHPDMDEERMKKNLIIAKIMTT